MTPSLARALLGLLALGGPLPPLASAQVQAPAVAGAGAPVSPGDRIYTGDQTSNTVTVVDPSSLEVLGAISLGEPRLGDALNPQFVGSVNSHGLGFSRDGAHIISLSTLSNTATVIRTSDNSVVSQTYVDRAPHEAFFAPDNRTAWIGTRGVSSVDVIDAVSPGGGGVIDRIFTGKGPSKVLFSPDGATAYVNHIFAPVVTVVDVATRRPRYNITGLADAFSSDMMLSADGGSLWCAHKMTGQTSVIDVAARRVVAVLETGPETNHPNFAVVNGTTHAFVTVASLNETKVYRQPRPRDRPVLVKAIRMTGIEPHGIWPSPDNSRMYVVNEHSDTVDVIDTAALEIVDTVRVGQEGQALIYVAGAVPEGQDGRANLGRQGLDLKTANKIVAVAGERTAKHAAETAGVSEEEGNSLEPNAGPQALVTVRQTAAGLDMVQVIGRNLVVNGTYTASARCLGCAAGQLTPLVTFEASGKSRNGCGNAGQVLAFLKFFGAYDLDSLRVEEGSS